MFSQYVVALLQVAWFAGKVQLYKKLTALATESNNG